MGHESYGSDESGRVIPKSRMVAQKLMVNIVNGDEATSSMPAAAASPRVPCRFNDVHGDGSSSSHAGVKFRWDATNQATQQ